MLQQPLIIPISPRLYKLVASYSYLWLKDGVQHELGIRKGFIYDGASVPRALWSLIGLRPDGLVRPAALLHDYLYRFAGDLPAGSYVRSDDGPLVWSREAADRLFARVMREAGVGKWKRRMAYRAVRTFAWRAWSKNAKR